MAEVSATSRLIHGGYSCRCHSPVIKNGVVFDYPWHLSAVPDRGRQWSGQQLRM